MTLSHTRTAADERRRRSASRAAVRWLAAGATLAAACGDGAPSAATTESTATTATPSSSTAPSTSDTTTTSSADTTTSSPPPTTRPTTTTTTTDATTTTSTTTPDTTTTVDTTIDESALALAEAGLYSIPSAAMICDFARTPVVAYLNPARGGDTYAVCIPNQDVFENREVTPATLTVTWPGAAAPVAVDVDTTWGSDLGSDFSAPLVLTHADGRRRAVGLDYRYGSPPNADRFIAIPMYLPHGRPAGTWRFTYEADGIRHEFAGRIDSGCPPASPVTLIDPLVMPGDLEFTSNTSDVPFPTCRPVPDVVTMSLDGAIDELQEFYDAQDIDVTFDVTTTCADAGSAEGVDGQTPNPGLWYRTQIDAGTAEVGLRAVVECPPVPSLVPLPIEEALDIVAAVADDYPFFTWTVDASCVPETIVITQFPEIFPGRTTSSVDIARCA